MPSAGAIETVETYRFHPDHLASPRPDGVSAFLRIRNGAAFLEQVIRSHIDLFDEIVAVYNACTDDTPDILARLAGAFGARLRVFHYLPEVYPQGSRGHRSEPGDSPRSVVTFSNLALAKTRFATAVKLDDDHIALADEMAKLTARVRAGAFGPDRMVCFSGFNLDTDPNGRLALPRRELFSGSGDIGFFPVASGSHFRHDPRFERFRRVGLRRIFGGFVYWHMKYLKPAYGFGNYDLKNNPDSRYHRRFAAFRNDRRMTDLARIGDAMTPTDRLLLAARAAGVPIPEKLALYADRWRAALDLAASGLAIPDFDIPDRAPVSG